MSSKVAIQLHDDITNFEFFVLGNRLKKEQKIDVEFEINRFARVIIESPLGKKDREELFDRLLRVRDLTIHHFPVNGLKVTCLFLNTIQNVPPSPLCPAYNKLAFPTISTYNTIGNNFVCIRLDPKALALVPGRVLEKAGSLEGKEVDLLYTVVHGEFYQNQKRSLNNNVHPWAHIHALPGDDTACDVNMGIFPEIGLEKANVPGAVAFNHLSPMNVHVHPRSGTNGGKGNMDYSPDNAHFNLVPGSPFSVDWSVMQKDNRVAITKRVVLFDETHPICQAIINSIYGCRDLLDHINRLEGVAQAIDTTLIPVSEAFAYDDPDAMRMFHHLPTAFQHGIYYQAWAAFDHPLNIHPDFGRASFENDNGLAEQYHCTNNQRAVIVNNFSAYLHGLLVDSQRDLLHSQSLVKGDNVLTMMKCAQLFFKRDVTEALKAYQQLQVQEREAIQYAYWELNGCPRTGIFDPFNFPTKIDDAKLKRQSILLAASRQPHRFEKPLIENVVESNAVNGDYELPPELLTPEMLGEFQPFKLNTSPDLDDSDLGNFFIPNPPLNYVDNSVRVEEVNEDEELPASSAYSSTSSTSSSSTTNTTTTDDGNELPPGFLANIRRQLQLDPEFEVEDVELPASSAYSSTSSTSSSTTTNTSTTTTTATTTQPTPEEVNNLIINLVYDIEFQSRSNKDKASSVNNLLAILPKEQRDSIYGSVWHNSRDEKKGGDSWGENHVADDLEVLVEALQQVFGAGA